MLDKQTEDVRDGIQKLKELTKGYNALSKNVDELRKCNAALRKNLEGAKESASSEAIIGYKTTIADLVVSERTSKRKREEAEQKLGGVQMALNSANDNVETWKAKYKKTKSALDAAIA